MPIYVQFAFAGLPANAGKGKVHKMSFGTLTVTPRSLENAVFHVMGESTGRSSAQNSPHQPLVISKEKSASSPLIFNAACTQEGFTSLDLNFVQANPSGKEQVVATITLTNAIISGYRTYHGLLSPPNHHPKHGSVSVHTNELEEFQLTFQKITYSNVFKSKRASDDWLTG